MDDSSTNKGTGQQSNEIFLSQMGYFLVKMDFFEKKGEQKLLHGLRPF